MSYSSRFALIWLQFDEEISKFISSELAHMPKF
ncbi:hypothetical protein QF004_000445 [Chryseobacterium sp. MDT2-18]|nr:hypothetical protein [Chryseobacterium sp. MDT2-18]